MKTLKVYKPMLVDSFDYQAYQAPVKPRDPISYAAPVNIKHCRIDHKTVFSQDSNESKVLADGTIYVYASATEPFLEFKAQSKVVIDGEKRIITKVRKLKEAFADKVFAYELEFL